MNKEDAAAHRNKYMGCKEGSIFNGKVHTIRYNGEYVDSIYLDDTQHKDVLGFNELGV